MSMFIKPQWLALLALAAVACSKNETKSSTVASAAAPVSASSAAEMPSPEQLARKELEEAWKNFTSGDDELRTENYTELRETVDKLKGKLPDAQLQTKVSKRADDIIAERAALRKTITELPEKPVYDGAYRLAGSVRRCYKDGVALESQRKLYFIQDAECPDTTLLHGWVEDTGEVLTLDFGRSGRQAKVVKISDKETAQDDRRVYNEKMAEYAKAIAANPRAPKEREQKEARDKELEEELVAVLKAFATGAPPPPPRSSTVPAVAQPAAASPPAMPPDDPRYDEPNPY